MALVGLPSEHWLVLLQVEWRVLLEFISKLDLLVPTLGVHLNLLLNSFLDGIRVDVLPIDIVIVLRANLCPLLTFKLRLSFLKILVHLFSDLSPGSFNNITMSEWEVRYRLLIHPVVSF